MSFAEQRLCRSEERPSILVPVLPSKVPCPDALTTGTQEPAWYLTQQQYQPQVMKRNISALSKRLGTNCRDTISTWTFKKKLFSPKCAQRLQTDLRLLQICANERPQNKMVPALPGKHPSTTHAG